MRWPRPDWLTELCKDSRYRWAGLQWDRYARTPGAWYDAAKAQHCVDMWPRWFSIPTPPYAGQPFVLLPYQEAIVRFIFGWKIRREFHDIASGGMAVQHVRLVRRLLLWMSRKGAKTDFCAALGIAAIYCEGIELAEGYVFARSEDQARTPFGRIQAHVGHSPGIAHKDNLVLKDSVYFGGLRSRIEIVTGTAKGKHGKLPSFIWGDEIHEWRDTAVMDTMHQGTASLREPLELYCSTAGVGEEGPGPRLYEETLQIIDGRIEDVTTLGVVFAADPEDDPFDETIWPKANPMLGISPTWDYMRSEAAKARLDAQALANFKAYHLGIWTHDSSRFIDIAKWDEHKGAGDWKTRVLRLKGRKCYLGVDLSWSDDYSAIVLLFPPLKGPQGIWVPEAGQQWPTADYTDEDQRWLIACRFYQGRDGFAKQPRIVQQQFERWKASGAVTLQDSGVVDQAEIQRDIAAIFKEFDVQRMGFDPFMAGKLYTDLVNSGIDGKRFLEVRQGMQSLCKPTEALAHMYRSGELDHGGHPVLRYMAGNVVVRRADNNMMLMSKLKSHQKIDGMSALANAIAAAMVPVKRSVYETRGVVSA